MSRVCLIVCPVELDVACHKDLFDKLATWGEERTKYLTTIEPISSVGEAQLELGLLDAYRRDIEDIKAGNIASLETLGEQIRTAEYKTEHSEWSYPKPGEVKDLETRVQDLLTVLDGHAKIRQDHMDDALAREILRAQIELKADRHAGDLQKVENWASERMAYLEAREDAASIAEAQFLGRQLEAFRTEKVLQL